MSEETKLKIEEEYYQQTFNRGVQYHIDGDFAVSVNQMPNGVEVEMSAPTINSISVERREFEFAEIFAEALQRAIKQAKEWHKDTGKDFREVLK